MRKVLFLLFFTFVSARNSHSSTIIRLNVETVMRNQIDKELLLTSEHHFSKKMISGEELEETLNEQMNILVKASFSQHFSNQLLPSDKISVEGRVRYSGIAVENEFAFEKFSISLYEKKFINLKINEKKSVDITIYAQMESFDDL